MSRHVQLCRLLSVAMLYSLTAQAEETPYRHAGEPIGGVREIYDGTLYPDIQVNTFRNIDRLFPVRIVRHGTPQPLPADPTPMSDFRFTVGGETFDLYDVLSLNRVSGLLIVADGTIRFEKYLLGNGPDTRWMSMSIVKSITSTLIGAAIQDGHIRSIDDPIVDYLPQFEGSAYDGVTVRHLLQMCSGVAWNETYTDPNSDRRHMLELQIAQEPGAILELMASLPRAAEPGTRWNYSTGETHVAGRARARRGRQAGRRLPVRENLVAGRHGSRRELVARSARRSRSRRQRTVSHAARLRALRPVPLHDGVLEGERVLPEGWIAEASSPKLVGGQTVAYGYMLWPLHERSYAAEGIFGQYVFVDPDRDLVVAMWSAQPKPVGRHAIDEYEFLKALSRYFE